LDGARIPARPASFTAIPSEPVEHRYGLIELRFVRAKVFEDFLNVHNSP
jgi:hypothetical protein